MDPTLTEPFDPTPAIAEKIIHDLTSPDLTLRDIADLAKTSLESLSAWLAKDEVAERISNLQGAIAARSRLMATNYIPSVINSLQLIVSAYADEEQNVPVRPTSIMDREQRRRA